MDLFGLMFTGVVAAIVVLGLGVLFDRGPDVAVLKVGEEIVSAEIIEESESALLVDMTTARGTSRKFEEDSRWYRKDSPEIVDIIRKSLYE